jgi:hypothetical protein
MSTWHNSPSTVSTGQLRCCYAPLHVRLIRAARCGRCRDSPAFRRLRKSARVCGHSATFSDSPRPALCVATECSQYSVELRVLSGSSFVSLLCASTEIRTYFISSRDSGSGPIMSTTTRTRLSSASNPDTAPCRVQQWCSTFLSRLRVGVYSKRFLMLAVVVQEQRPR